MIIVVSGLPRSSTAMMMKMLKEGGIQILSDDVKKPDDNNPQGYFEYDLVSKLPEGKTDWLEEAEGKVVKVISYFLHHLPPKHEYRVLFMERNFSEILKSQKKTIIEEKQKIHKKEDKMMEDYYKTHIKQTKEWLSLQPNFSVIYLSYNELVKNPNQDLSKLSNFLEHELNLDKMSKAIDQNLYRQRS